MVIHNDKEAEGKRGSAKKMNDQQNQELKERQKKDNVVIQVIPIISTMNPHLIYSNFI